MKKIVLLLMALLLSVSVIACSNDTSSKSSKTDEKHEDKDKNKKDDDEKNGNHDEETMIDGVSKAVLEASKFEPVLQIGTKVLQLPFTFQEVVDAGAVVNGNQYTGDYMMLAGQEIMLTFTHGDGMLIMTFHNPTDGICLLKDAEVRSGALGISSSGSSVYYAGGIHVGSTLTELQNTWGTPDGENSDSTSFIYYYHSYPKNGANEKGNQYQVVIDRNTAKVTNVSMVYTPKLDRMMEFVSSHRYASKAFDFIVPMPYYAYYASAYGNHYTVESVDGAKYVINYPALGHINTLSNVDYSPTEEALKSVLSSNIYKIRGTVEETTVLQNDEKIGLLAVFYQSSETGYYTCRIYALQRELGFCAFFENSIRAYDGGELSDSAKAYFIESMKEIMSGCEYRVK